MFAFARTVLDTFCKRPVTRRYPLEKRPDFALSRGKLAIDPAVCIYCSLCAKRCPADALAVTRQPEKTWTVDRYKCVLCGYCAEVCPKKCLSFTPYGG